MIRILPRGSTKTIALLGDEQETTALWLGMQKVAAARQMGKSDINNPNSWQLPPKNQKQAAAGTFNKARRTKPKKRRK